MKGKWSDELKAYTIEHFGDLGSTCMKSINGGFAIAYDRNLFITDRALKVIPKEAEDKRYILTDYDTGEFVAAYDFLEDLVDDGWAID